MCTTICLPSVCFFVFFFFNDTATTEIYTLSLHDALPIYPERVKRHHGEQKHAREHPRRERRDLDVEHPHAERHAGERAHHGGREPADRHAGEDREARAGRREVELELPLLAP